MRQDLVKHRDSETASYKKRDCETHIIAKKQDCETRENRLKFCETQIFWSTICHPYHCINSSVICVVLFLSSFSKRIYQCSLITTVLLLATLLTICSILSNYLSSFMLKPTDYELEFSMHYRFIWYLIFQLLYSINNCVLLMTFIL